MPWSDFAKSLAADAANGLSEKKLQEALVSVAEQEQERIGRELHDGLGQELAGAAFLAKALAGKLAGTDAKAAADAEWIKTILGRCIESVRALSQQLSPTALEQGNAVAALERLCADIERSYGIACSFALEREAPWAGPLIEADVARHLFRVCQEALNNATRHGACRRLQVRLACHRRQMRLAIIDDGHGFAVPSAAPTARSSGIGLGSMRLRARSLGGRLRLARRAGQTFVILRAPMDLPCNFHPPPIRQPSRSP